MAALPSARSEPGRAQPPIAALGALSPYRPRVCQNAKPKGRQADGSKSDTVRLRS